METRKQARSCSKPSAPSAITRTARKKKIGPGLQGVKDGKLPSGKDATYDNLLDNLNKGGNGMPAFEKLITQEEKDNVIAYVLTL